LFYNKIIAFFTYIIRNIYYGNNEKDVQC